jgi:hypothetical protein
MYSICLARKNNTMTKVPSIPDSKTMQCFSCRTSNKSFFQLWLSAVKIRVIELYQENPSGSPQCPIRAQHHKHCTTEQSSTFHAQHIEKMKKEK